MLFLPNVRRVFRLRGATLASNRAEIDDEMRFHLQGRVDDLIARGLSEADARAVALKEFGDVARYRDDVMRIDRASSRDLRARELVASIGADLRFAWRGLVANPAFTLVALVTLAVGIGATTAVFGAVNGVILRPLPYPDAGRIVHIGERDVARPGPGGTTSYDNFADWQRLSHSFGAMGLVATSVRTLTGRGEPQRIRMAMVTPGIFDVFHVRPMLGRSIVASDGEPGAAPVLVLGNDLWRTEFGGDSTVVGGTALLNGVPATIVGVLPPGFTGPGRLDRPVWSNFVNDTSDGRTGRSKEVYALLRPAVSLLQAQAEMSRTSATLAAMYPLADHGETAVVEPLADGIVGGARRPLALLLCASFLVLLIACANLSNLLLARGLSRRRELAVRAALGAGRGRIVRQLLTENALLAGVGGAAGVLLARAAASMLVRLGPGIFATRPPRLDAAVLSAAVVLCLLTVLVAGLLPAIRQAARAPQSSLRGDGVRVTGGGGAVRRSLAVVQLALAVVLLVSAALVLKSFARVLDVDPGISPDYLLTAEITLPGGRYDSTRSTAFYDALADRLRAMPGVRGVGFSSLVPLSGDFDRIRVPKIAGEPERSSGDAPQADRYVVSPGWFATMGIRLLRGRLPNEEDRFDAPLVCVVDERFARRAFGGEAAAIGQRMVLPLRDGYATVVGVVATVKTYGLDAATPGQIYMSDAQYPWRWSAVAVRTTGDPMAFEPTLARAVHELDPDQPVADVATMNSLMSDLLRTRRFTLVLLGAFAGAAVLLALVGLYGVIAYGVSQRRREFSVRLALGARRAAIARLVVTEGARIAAAGALLGTVGALGVGRVLSSVLFEVGPHDPAVLASVVAGLVVVAIGACVVPALRATRIDAIEALRGE